MNKDELLGKIINTPISLNKKPRIDYVRDNGFGKITILRSQDGNRKYDGSIKNDRLFFYGIYNKKTGGYEEAPYSYEDQRMAFRLVTENIRKPSTRKKELTMLLNVIEEEAQRGALDMNFDNEYKENKEEGEEKEVDKNDP